MTHMERRFFKMKKEVDTKTMMFGMIVRVLLILLFLGAGYTVCEKAVDTSVKIQQEK